MNAEQINQPAHAYQTVFSFPDPEPLRALRHFEERLYAMIRSASRLRQGLCLATKTIAKKLNVSIRYVQEGLQELCERGLVVRIWDYKLRTRRRFFAVEKQPQTNQESPIVRVDSARSDAPTSDSPPISSGESLKEDAGAGRLPSTTDEKPEESLVAKAAEALSVTPATAEKIVANATQKAPSPDYVAAALDIAGKAAGWAENATRYFWGTLKGLIADGDLPEPPPPPPPVVYYQPEPTPPIDPILVGVTCWADVRARLRALGHQLPGDVA